ncbi:hypothetical protein HYPSUDRAFT_46397 [Hypholoma sublateritium FD-334 SS-4]|uniref:Uncharacterized protein n=1 Tax=Hypholoma sublateritium (strain FD-334 SS-4) TaxID=945553 RepID=A0A0D2PAT9_HYPSF|nr:hypothetical protein HYPSUDRAFT_46397 [Hypholoma sublateritium FD-334 SS-4]
MSTDTLVAASQLDEGCRILTISASPEGASIFISRLKALSKLNSGPLATVSAPPAAIDAGPVISSYVISNRYYTADVHFAAYTLQTVFPGLFSLDRGSDYKPPPALIFVWVAGEPYAKHVEELSRVMAAASYEPEVCLAVRIAAAARADGVPALELDEEQDENADIDTTLMSFGFEYVDGTSEAVPRAETGADDVDQDIPRLPRVIDALSTIMWPSMQSSRSTKEPRPSAAISSASMARREWERDSIMDELLSVSGISGISRSDLRHSPATGAADSEHGPDTDDDEIDALFSPYVFNSNAHFSGPSPLIQASTTQKEHLVASPTEITAAASPFGLHAAAFGAPNADARQVSLAFEDDFTVFVSAPAEDVASAGAGAGTKSWNGLDLDLDLAHVGFAADDATPLATAFADSVVTGDSLGARNAGLTPVRAQGRGRGGGLYRALGSVSDFGGDEAERRAEQALGGSESTDDEDEDVDEEWEDAVEDGVDESWGEDVDAEEGDDDDAEMPTQGEILATAARIFGGAPAGGSAFRTASEVNRAARAQAAVAPGAHGGGDAGAGANADAADDGLGPAGPIDIEHVLRSLQGLRTEIAGVEDEEERRRMAARVALGFVYGMDLGKAASGATGER